MSSGSPIGCFAYCGCADGISEWNLSLLASAGWDCSIAPATGYVTAGPGGSGISGAAGVTVSIGVGVWGSYYYACDGFFIDSGMIYTNNC